MLLDEEDQATNRVVCEIVTGMQHSILGLDDTIFSAWEVATMCFYVAEGGCFYRRESAAPLRQLSNIWVAEACLWTPWLYLGNLIATEISRLIVIDVASFCACVGKDHEVKMKAAAFATDFVRRLNQQKRLWSVIPLDVRSSRRSNLPQEVTRPGWFTCCRGRAFDQVVPS